MNDNTVIKTTKTIYPQIYAYTLPTIPENTGWIKIGYTERKNVDERILEQTKTAAVNLPYDKLWSEPAKFSNIDKWFTDKQLHSYLKNLKQLNNVLRRNGSIMMEHQKKLMQILMTFVIMNIVRLRNI